MRYRNNRSVYEYWVNLEVNVHNATKHRMRSSRRGTASGKTRCHSKVRSSKSKFNRKVNNKDE